MMEAKGIGVGITKTASEEEIYQAIVRVRDDEKSVHVQVYTRLVCSLQRGEVVFFVLQIPR